MIQKIRKSFTKEFKEEAANLVIQQKYSIATAARQLGISESNIGRWVQELKIGQKLNHRKVINCDVTNENKALKKVIARLEMENEILKKAAAFFATATLQNTYS
jgi:transposase